MILEFLVVPQGTFGSSESSGDRVALKYWLFSFEIKKINFYFLKFNIYMQLLVGRAGRSFLEVQDFRKDPVARAGLPVQVDNLAGLVGNCNVTALRNVFVA